MQEGIDQGIDQGIQQGQCQLIENLLKSRFGALDDELGRLIEPLLQ